MGQKETRSQITQEFEGGLDIRTGQEIDESWYRRSLEETLYDVNMGKFPAKEMDLSVVNGYVEEITGGKIPSELIEALGFDDLNFFFINDPDARELLVLGFRDDLPNEGLIKNAKASIVINRLRSGIDDRVVIDTIGITGIHQDAGVLFGVSFLASDLACTKFEVSFPEEDIEKENIQGLTVKIPTDLGRIAGISGVYSTAMVEDLERYSRERHGGVLRFFSSTREVRDVGSEFLSRNISVEQTDAHHVIRSEKYQFLDGIMIPITLES